jgi:Ni/Co efflux regulator RcnB
MNKKQWTAVATALVMGSASWSAWAQPGHGGPQGQVHRPAQGGPHYQAPAPHAPMARPGAHPVHPHGMPPGQAKRMGVGPQHNWVKGSRVPAQYRTPHYVVSDWRNHGLQRPGRGQQWVQYGSDYLLVAIATGVISQLIYGH